MSPGGSPAILLPIKSRPIQIVSGFVVYSYFVEARLYLWVHDDPEQFRTFSFQLDTKSDVTTVPAAWVTGNSRRFGVLSSPITAAIETAGGSIPGAGRMAKGVRFRLEDDPDESHMDMLVSTTLKTDYGLLSLHDLHNHYLLRTEGPFHLDGDKPVALGRLRLERRQVRSLED